MEEREELRPWQPAALAHSSGSIPSTEVIRLFHKAEQRNRVDLPAKVESWWHSGYGGDYRPSPLSDVTRTGPVVFWFGPPSFTEKMRGLFLWRHMTARILVSIACRAI
jgi:hypothetical protein